MEPRKKKIELNKDLNEYKNSIFKGLDGRDILFGGIGLAIGAVTAFTVGYYLKVEPELCIAIGMLPAAPVFFLGLYRIQGMSIFSYLKEFLYDKMTEELFYDADELPENDTVWTMQKEMSKGRRKK